MVTLRIPTREHADTAAGLSGSPGYEFVEYDPRYREQVVQLQTGLWDPDPERNADYFAWKYERNPYNHAPIVYLVLAAGRVVAMRGFSAGRWTVGDPARIVPALHDSDIVVSPEHQGHALSVRIGRYALSDLTAKGHRLVLSSSALAPMYFARLKHDDFRLAVPYLSMRRQTASHAVLSGLDGLLHRGARRLPMVWRLADRQFFGSMTAKGGLAASAVRYPGGSGVGTGGHVTIDDTPLVEEMAGLVKRRAHDGRMTHVRDREFFAWRFMNPLSRYRFLFWQGDRLEGYLVLRSHARRNPAAVSIVDVEFSGDAVLRELLAAAKACAEADSLTIWSATLPASALETLKQAGYRHFDDSRGHAGYVPGMLVRSNVDDPAPGAFSCAGVDFLDRANWDLRMIFADNY